MERYKRIFKEKRGGLDPYAFPDFEQKFIGKGLGSATSQLDSYDLGGAGISPVINSSGIIVGFIHENDDTFQEESIDNLVLSQVNDFWVYEI